MPQRLNAALGFTSNILAGGHVEAVELTQCQAGLELDVVDAHGRHLAGSGDSILRADRLISCDWQLRVRANQVRASGACAAGHRFGRQRATGTIRAGGRMH